MRLKRLRPSLLKRIATCFGGRDKLLADSIVGEVGADKRYRAQLCTRGGLKEACDLTRHLYGQAYVSDDVAEQWRLSNPYAFVQMMNKRNLLCASFGILALRQSFMDVFIAGQVSDQQLRAEDIMGWPESKEATRLYISGVIVLESTGFQGHRRATVMFWTMLEYIRQLYGLSTTRQLYAVAVTPKGAQVLRNHGFVVETRAAHRRDERDLYRFELTESSWNGLLCEFNDWSNVCDVDFALQNHSDSAGAHMASSSEGDGMIRILFVAGDRGGSQRNQVQIPREFISIKEAIQKGDYREAFNVVAPILGATREMLVEACRDRPVILHFAGHGDDRSLSFILDQELLVTETRLEAEQLAVIIGNFTAHVRLCVINTCDSASVAAHLTHEAVVDAAIGWPSKVNDDIAIAFSRVLYGRLGDGLPLENSLNLASQSYGGKDSPVLHTREGVDRNIIFAG